MVQAPGAAGHVLRSAGDLTAVDGLAEEVPLGVRLTFGDAASSAVLLGRVNGYAVALRWPPSSKAPAEGAPVTATKESAVVCKPDALLGCSPIEDVASIISFAEGSSSGGVTWPLPERRVMADIPGVPVRTPITRSLHTGVAAVDVLTPVGRGQCMLLVGERGSGKTALALDALAAQANSGVPCVYAAVGHADMPGHAQAAVSPHTVVVAPPRDASPGIAFLATCAAFALGEAWRDAGRDALLIVNTAEPAVAFWHAAAQLVPAPMPANGSEDDMVQIDGMLVSASAAERRRFFSSFLQRCARLNADHGAGSLTLLSVLACAPGAYAFGSGALAKAQAELSAARSKLASYATLSEEQKRKLLAALEAKVVDAQRNMQHHSDAATDGTVSRPVVEEFMSVSDGQIFLQRPDPATDGPHGAVRYLISPRDSVSRIGLEAASPALRTAGSGAARLELAQADDADAFAAGEEAAMKVQQSAARLRAALMQPSGRPLALSQEVLTLLAVRAGACSIMPLEQLSDTLHSLHASLVAQPGAAAALRSIDETGELTAAAETALMQALKAV